jgi:hydroxymethylglutaryl-CoA lyase
MKKKKVKILIKLKKMKIIECPRDAMQGISRFIPTELKAKYINKLLNVGFDTIDFGSFVSPKVIPQLRDTAKMLNLLDIENSKSKLLSIVANKRGAEDAVQFPEINYLGYPFSVSETFQIRNTNSTIEQSLARVEEIQNLCINNEKELIVYLSMGFGNPYGDDWSADIVAKWAEKIANLGIKTISLSDTIGVANPEIISQLFSTLIPEFSDVEFGAHLHTTQNTWHEKLDAAIKSGCRRFDGAIKGYGGCPMAEDKLTGNMPTEKIIKIAKENNIILNIDENRFEKAFDFSSSVFH